MDATISPVIVPYSGGIPGGCRPGMEIEVQGTIPHHARDGFSINLCQGPQLEPSTNLHFNVRLNEHCVVMNHMQGNSWGGEQRQHGMHFHKGKPFDLRIMVKPQMFKLKVNGNHVADFAHRLPKESAQFIVIKGEVAVSYIKFAGGHGGHGGAVPAPQPAGQQIYNPPVPFTGAIPGGIYPGRMISISGVPLPNVSRFTINLQNGSYAGGDVALHFDARFRYGSDMNTVVRNHCQGGAWGQEERGVSYFPFMPNANFDILILCEAQAFKVAVNNQHLVEFRHRLPIQAANTLSVTGDVRLTQVNFR